MIVIRKRGQPLAMRIRPDWREIVQGPDRNYIRELFNDFAVRAKYDPDGLFRQLCGLSVGPLVTLSVDSDLDHQLEMRALWQDFVDFKPESPGV